MSPDADVARATAPAKINPWLEVLGRRPDGFHELDTWMLALDLCDAVEVRREPGAGGVRALRVVEAAPGAADGCPDDASNLAWRAAEAVLALASARGQAPSTLSLVLYKSIPSEAGLGGGSADAAAAALAAASVLGLRGDDPALVEALARLGSDCSFFLAAASTGVARCRGRGERVFPASLPADPPSVVLVTPAARASTPAVYGALARVSAGGEPRATPALAALLSGGAPPFCRLEAAALHVAPELSRWSELLAEAHRETASRDREHASGSFTLSGSGSSFFAFRSNHELGEALVERVRALAKARDLGLRLATVVRARGAGVSLA